MNRVKLNVKTRAPISERTDRPPCEICKRQISRYVCPTCNLPYCSLTCFKSENHSECSESFYRKEIETDIKLDPQASTDEKRKMMEMLRRFEEGDAQDVNGLTQDSGLEAAEDDEDELASNLEGIDLDATDSDKLWSLLSPDQRNKFLQAMRDPSSQLAQQLLVADELSEYHIQPWWESPALQTDESIYDRPGLSTNRAVRYGSIPDMMPIPEQLIASARDSPASFSRTALLYNVLATCLAYAYVTRKLLTSPLSSIKTNDPDRKMARDLFGRVAPFLTEKRSTLVFSSVDDIVTSFWSHTIALSDTPTNTSMAKLLADAALLLKPQSIITINANDDDKDGQTQMTNLPCRITLLVLSDISRLFADIKYISHKLNFYAAQLCVVVHNYNSRTLQAVSEEAQSAAVNLESQSQAQKEDISVANQK